MPPPLVTVFLGFLALTPLFVSAQNAFAINNIDIPKSHNGTATIVAGNSFLSFVNATVVDGFVYSVCIIVRLKKKYSDMTAGPYWQL